MNHSRVSTHTRFCFSMLLNVILILSLLLGPVSLASAQEPTATLTAEPTEVVTDTPEPTVEPTVEPTLEPTIEPTVEPTVEPTIAPTETPEALPNLVFAAPEGWDAPLVVSSQPGTHTNDELVSGSEAYLDLAVLNDGTADIATLFTLCLKVDGEQRHCWDGTSLLMGEYFLVEDWPLPALEPGVHSFEVLADVNNNLLEMDKLDNVLALDLTWAESELDTEMVIPTEQSFSWTLKINGSSDPQITNELEALDSLTTQGMDGEIVGSKLNLSGSESIGQMKQTIYEGLPPGFDFLGGPISLLITYPAEAGKEVVIHLEARTTTGFDWVLLPSSEFEFSQIGQAEYQPRSKGLGIPSIQTLRFTPNFTGTGTLHLAYRRPFEPDLPITTELQVNLVETPAELDLSDPMPKTIGGESAGGVGEESTEAFDEIQLKGAMPTSFDWRTYGVVPAVRDQGSCGSCWSFGTVGVMESAVKIAGGPLEDLSEQFLISCNKDGWDCGGGLTANKYHYNTLGYNQTTIGAVLESAKPYTTSNGTCTIVPSHPYKLSSWKFITGSEWTVPTVDQIKSAIYTYGPITAGVCAGSGWNTYSGGVYSNNDNCGGSTNHQIILVGWNDSNQTWILRNSWGSSWGDGGYMHILWNTSRVGEGTSWVKYNTGLSIPAAPATVSPTTATVTNDPTVTLTWSSVTNAKNYDVRVDNNSDFSSPDSFGNSLTTTSFTTSSLNDGKYYWQVRSKNLIDQAGVWSTSKYFTVDTTPPAAPVLSKPLNGTQFIGTPTFSWLASATAKYYQVQYDDVDDGTSTYDYLSPDNLTVLTHKTTTTPALMTPIYWYVRARDVAGNWSAWSAPFTVTVIPPVPLVPVVTAPVSGLVTNITTPTLTWNTVAYANTYEIQIDELSTFTAPLVREVNGVNTLSHTLTTLPDGKYYWHVRARNVNNAAGPWSTARYFTIDTTPPAAPVLSKPLTGSQFIGNPTFTWLASATAKYYQVQYDNVDDGTVTYDYLSPTNLTILSHKPSVTPSLMTPTYWYVRAQDIAGNWSAWSAPFTVTVIPPVPVKPVLTAPVSALVTNNTTPTLAWNTVAYANTYEIQIDELATFTAPLVREVNGVTTLNHTLTALPDGKYFWRVRARNVNNDASPWSAYRYFTIDTTPPDAPVLSKPLNGSQFIGNPTFTWLASATAKYYQVQYDNVDDGTVSYDYLSPDNLTVLSHKPTTTPALMTPTYWYVRARDIAGNWSAWSAPFAVTVVPPVPLAPVVSAPASALVTNNTTPTLTWNAVAYANTYEIQIDELSTFIAPLVREVNGITTLNHTLAALPEGKYYWHVRARNVNNAAGPWSAARYFTIDTTPPAAPVLSLPANNAPGVRLMPTFKWLAATTANAYEFQYDNETSFSDPVSYLSGVLTVLYHKPSLAMTVGTWYWRVRARDAVGNWGGWSAYRTLTILPPAVTNGSFEAGGASWTQTSSLGYTLISTDLAHSGLYGAWLGGDNNEISHLTQTGINMTGARYLHFWYLASSQDVCGWDYAFVKVNGTSKKIFSLCSSTNTSVWKHQVIDLLSYSGSTVTLEFIVMNDSSYISNFFIDDVAITDSSATPSTVTLTVTEYNLPKAKSDSYVEPDGPVIK